MKNTPKINRLLVTFVALTAALPGQASPIEVPNWNFEVPRDDKLDGLVDGEDVYMVPLQQSWYQYNVHTNGGPQRYWNPGVPGVNDGGARFADVGFGGNAPEGDHVGIAITRYNDDKLPDGSNGALVRDFEALCQVLEDVVFDPNATYTLTVDVGHFPKGVDEGGSATGPNAGPPEWNGYMIQLLVGGEEFNEGSSYAPTVYGGTVIAEDNNTVLIPPNEFRTVTTQYTPNGEFNDLAGQPLQIRLCALEGPDHSLTSVAAFDKVLLDGPGETVAEPFEVTITAAADPNTGFALQWPGQPGMNYTVLTSTDLAMPVENWTVVEAGLAENSYNVPADGVVRFYVVKKVPNL